MKTMSIVLALLISGTFVDAAAAQVAGQAPAAAGKPAAKPELVLKNRVGQWMATRALIYTRCRDMCDGSGSYPGQLPNGQLAQLKCVPCSGTGGIFVKDKALKAYFDALSPAARGQKSARADFEANFKAYDMKQKWEISPRSHTWVRPEFIDDTHAISHVIEQPDAVAKTYEWILVTENGKPQWFLWTEAVDGPWPDPAESKAETHAIDEAVATTEEAAPDEEPVVEVIDDAPEDPEAPLRALVQAVAADVEASWRLSSFARSGSTLTVNLNHSGPPDKATLDASVQRDSVTWTRAILPHGRSAEYDEVRLVFEAFWQDEDGQQVLMPVCIAVINYDRFERTGWDNLDPAARWKRFTSSKPVYAGWSLAD